MPPRAVLLVKFLHRGRLSACAAAGGGGVAGLAQLGRAQGLQGRELPQLLRQGARQRRAALLAGQVPAQPRGRARGCASSRIISRRAARGLHKGDPLAAVA